MAIFTVTTSADVVDSGDAHLSLREAVAAAATASGEDTIRFAPALEGTTLALTGGALDLSGPLAIDGDQNDDGVEVTLSAGGAGRVLAVAGSSGNVALADLGITGGAVDGEGGGGILLGAGSALSLAGCTVSGNRAGLPGADYQAGGAILAARGSSLTIAGSLLSNNVAGGDGGAILAGPGATVTVVGSRLEGNSGYYGGAIAAVGDSVLTLETSRLTANTAGSGYGGYGGYGGAVFVRGSTVSVDRSTLADNEAFFGGGGIAAVDSRLTITDSTLAGNRVLGSETVAGSGGGVLGLDGTAEIERSTVTGNSVRGPDGGFLGGGVAVTGALTLADSIIVGNALRDPLSDAVLRLEDLGGTIASSNGHNILGGTAVGAIAGDRVGVAPALLFAALDPATGGGLLADNGGSTPTVALRDALDNPALAGASYPPAAADQRGVARPQPVDSLGDVGAFELDQGTVSTRPTLDNDRLTGTAGEDAISASSGADWLRGLGGNDTLYGNVDSDLVDGGEGADQLYGGTGEDVLRGEAGEDGLWGWEGGDLLLGGADADRLFGEAGDDRLVGGAEDDLLNGGAGLDVASWLDDGVVVGVAADLALGTAERGVGETDRLIDIEHLEGTSFADTLRGDAASNRLDGAGGADRLLGLGGDDLLIGSLGGDQLDGGSGESDRVSYEALGLGVVVRLASGAATKGAEVDSLAGIEHVAGSGLADTLRGDAGANELHGLDGTDVLAGGFGKDVLAGGWGRDVFQFDTAAESAAGPARDVISDFTPGVDRIDLATIDAVVGTGGVDEAFTFIDDAAFSAAGELRFWFDGDRTVLQANTGGTLDPELAIELTGVRTLAAEDFVL